MGEPAEKIEPNKKLSRNAEAVVKIVTEQRDQALETVRQLRAEIGELKEALSDVERERDEAQEEASNLESALEEAEAKAVDPDRLARIHSDIKGRNPSEGLYQLEAVLSEMDSAWRTRA